MIDSKRTQANHESDLESNSLDNLLTIRFENGEEKAWNIKMTITGSFQQPALEENPKWAQLEIHKCPFCTLRNNNSKYCPAAESLASTLFTLKDHNSYEPVTARIVDSAGRSTTVNWPLQEVGSIFVQLAVFSSECPIGLQFKPLLKDLRPFATNEELSKHLISKFLLKHRGKVERARKDILQKMEPIRVIFSQLSRRLASDSGGDAMANSIVRLDAFALNISLYIEEVLEQVKSEMGWALESSNLIDYHNATKDPNMNP